MNSLSEALLPAGIVLAIGGAVAWVLWTEPPLAHAVVALDHSLSVRQDCAKFRQEGEALVHEKAGIRNGSTLALMVMGREASAPNAELTFAEPVPMPPEEIYGRNMEEYEQAKRMFFDQIEHGCDSLEPALHSPIYRLVKQGIAQLRSLGCEADGKCYLLGKTDLVEDVDSVLAGVITRAAKDPAIEVPSELAGSIENAGVQIAFVGLAETRPVRNVKQPPAQETLQRLWQAMFTHPELVSFTPYCGGRNGAQ